jgi:hypothetical protein
MRKVTKVAFALFLVVSSPSLAEMSHGISAREAGARYAQALGASETCPGVHISKSAEALRQKFRGGKSNEFDVQSAEVYSSWQKVKNCSRPKDPNPCRIMIQLSCRSAVSEIGPSGSAVPNLLEIGPR